MKRYILTIDEGTTSVRAVLFDVKKQKIVRIARENIKLIEPRKNWVEQDANSIWEKTLNCLKELTEKIDLKAIYGLGIANQRETVVAWSKKTGEPFTNAIIWQCRRTAKYCEQLKKTKIASKIREKTGLIINSYFSATKIKWLLDNSKSVQKALKNKDLCIGTIETYLVYRLTKCKVFITDVTNASRTMLFNIKTLKWDTELLNYFKIPSSILAEPVDNDKVVGYTNILGESILIAGLIGDQQSSLLGQGCWHKGDIKNTYGTGCFMLANTGGKPIKSQNNLLTTIANRINHKTFYALEGSIFSGGSIINDAIKKGIASNHKKLAKMASSVKKTNLYLIPAYHGLGCPYWLMNAQPKFINFNKQTSKKEIAKAYWDAIAYRNNDVYAAMLKDIRLKPKKVCVDGGLSQHKYLMQLQSDLFQTPISIVNLESTCMGAIICTGLATKVFKLDDINLRPRKTYYPKKQMDVAVAGWKKVIDKYIKETK